MVGPEHEQPQNGTGEFEDSVLVELADAERDLFGLVRLCRMPGAPAVSALALVFAGGRLALRRLEVVPGAVLDSWERAEVGGARMEIVEPLRRWYVALSGDGVTMELEASAISAPIDLTEPPTAAVARSAGVRRYEQLCDVRGEANVNGSRLELAGTGRRAHAWGLPLPEGGLVRSLYAVSEDEALSVTAARPQPSAAHGEEVLAAFLARPDEPPALFEDARLSTIYDGSGAIRKAGLELYMPGDEYPRRASGQARAATVLESGGVRLAVSFFGWSVQGTPAQGSYQVVSRA
jgi:hypothetical protein